MSERSERRVSAATSVLVPAGGSEGEAMGNRGEGIIGAATSVLVPAESVSEVEA